MIDAKELRRGNIIAFDDGSTDIVKVEFFYEEGGMWFVKWTKVHGNGTFKSGNSILQDFIPIPLTPNVLRASGFENDDGDFLLKIDDRTVIHINFEKKRYLLESYDGIIKLPSQIESLHQLQNLYFALTQTELNYKP